MRDDLGRSRGRIDYRSKNLTGGVSYPPGDVEAVVRPAIEGLVGATAHRWGGGGTADVHLTALSLGNHDCTPSRGSDAVFGWAVEGVGALASLRGRGSERNAVDVQSLENGSACMPLDGHG